LELGFYGPGHGPGGVAGEKYVVAQSIKAKRKCWGISKLLEGSHED